MRFNSKLPSHGSVLQDSSSSRSWQAAPPFSGSWTTFLSLVLVPPPPQVALHLLHKDQSSTPQSTEPLKNLFTGIRNNLGIRQCCKTPLPPKLDRGLLLSQPLEQLLFLSSWFHLRRLRCTWSTLTNLQLRSQLKRQEIISKELEITWALVSVAMLCFLQSWTDSSYYI